MIITSLNIGTPQKELFHGKEFTTGLCKHPVDTPLELGPSGFTGDGVQDKKHHGGEDKAVCVYSADHYPHWHKELGIEMPIAAFGENLTLSDCREESIHIGDIFTLGSATVQVSQPRQPCKTLAARFGRSDFVKLVVESGYTGFYLRVLKTGIVQPGEAMEPLEADPGKVSIDFANRIYHHERKNIAGLQRVLGVTALSASWRQPFEELLSKAG